MIDREIKRSLGQMMKGVQVVGAAHDGLVRAYCSHWVCQVSFEEPIVMASVSPKHDTFPLMRDAGRFTVSILAGDQVGAGQYFSYPGRKFHHLADEFLDLNDDGLPVVRDAIAWLQCETFEVKDSFAGGEPMDHHLFFARVVKVGEGRLREPPLLYSSRLGWRIAGDKAREPGTSVRDELLARLAASGLDDGAGDDDGDDEAG
jgi:flavin reductase (DIM6/NTAB) family NADH-FMN oxidoreductase RutF